MKPKSVCCCWIYFSVRRSRYCGRLSLHGSLHARASSVCVWESDEMKRMAWYVFENRNNMNSWRSLRRSNTLWMNLNKQFLPSYLPNHHFNNNGWSEEIREHLQYIYLRIRLLLFRTHAHTHTTHANHMHKAYALQTFTLQNGFDFQQRMHQSRLRRRGKRERIQLMGTTN